MTSQAACRLGISIYIVQPEASAVVLLLKALGLLGCPSFTITAVRILFFGRLFFPFPAPPSLKHPCLAHRLFFLQKHGKVFAKMRFLLIQQLLLIAAQSNERQRSFVHPGGWHSVADIERVRARVTAEQEVSQLI